MGAAKAIDLSERLVLARAASNWDHSIGLISQIRHAALCWAGVLADLARNHDWDVEARFLSVRCGSSRYGEGSEQDFRTHGITFEQAVSRCQWFLFPAPPTFT
ncbi:hypothetical protein [Methylobacterium sp. WL116]|uniref:hypothetical protein n=1 Tax=Methylobacterium sp. WL116 TaxID=2603889 RepID=UPI0011D77DCF|nr:hypothetical protein [Methylobacterium sp. WL116]TXM90762.1 hypothetical protein FV223_17450 [Methylobacterium sp. WL116]